MKMQKSVSVVPLLLLLCLSGVGVTKGQGVEVTKAVDFKTEFEVKTPADRKTDGQTDSEPDLWAELRALRDMGVAQRVEKREAVMQSQLEDVKTQKSDLQAQSVSPPAELSVRLVNGRSSCSGTVEVFYEGEWSGVCTGWWSMKDVMVVCRELRCGNAVAVSEGPLVEDGRRGVAIKSCRGHESTITECGFREGGPGYCDGRNDHYVICSDLQAQSVRPPAELSVRLVNGTTSCSGTVEVFNRGEWFGLCPGWWGMKEAKVVCRELDCGNFVDVSRGPLVEDGRRIYVSCSLYGDESIGQCYKDEGRKNCDGEYYHHVTCSESVRLVDGAGLCSGRVEVKSNQSWASVCEPDFDRQDAEVVCRELGCGAPAALQGGLYGGGEGQTWDKDFQCKGNESLLLDCDTSDRKNNTCLPGNAVGLTCSEPDDVRLVGGGSRCAGGVERYDQGEWRTVGTDDWDQEDVAAVVCRQLGCGSTVSVLPGNTTRGFEVQCSESESSLRECSRRSYKLVSPRSYYLLPGLTVICSDLLVQSDISLTDSMGGVSRGHQGPEVFRGYSFTITCSTQPQYPGGSFLLTFTGSNRTQTQPAVNHSAAFLFPAADDSHQGNYSCVYDNYVFSHIFSSESELLSLTITASPLPAFIIRHVVVLLLLLTAITTSYLYYKPTRRQKRVNRVSSMDLDVNAMEMVSLSSRAEAGPGEERAAQGTE